ncbi:MAG TPA: 6-hydroxymethylpterin diphosphokinase MptE-like protein, partial [Candidatus Acidoferrum sp.]|nr:6-hydroxymethylpterin diphosphokinase MptE-like protein [Candidatus Acidoferrum sp.]
MTAPLGRLEQSLAELAGLGQTMMQAIDAGDHVRLLVAMQVARGLRARLKGRSAPAAQAGAAPASLAELERLRQLVSAAQMTEKIAERWLGRPLPPDRELLATPGGDLFLADAMLPGVWDFERDLVVLVGPGLASVANALRQLGQERILWYQGGDPDAAEARAALRVEHLDEVAAAVRGFGVESPQRLAVRALDPAGADLCAEVAGQFNLGLSDGHIQRNTVMTFHRNWLEQGLANLPSLCRWPTVAALDGLLAGKPLVIIAPGPSLGKNIDLLAGLKGKAVLLAVSHALTPLTRAGVVPDFVLAVDPQDLRYHYAGSPLDGVAAVINAVTVCPELFALGAPHYLSLSANGALDDWLCDLVGERAVVSGGGSVATTAFSLALRWGCDPIAVVGLDLSFEGGRYYIETSCDGQARAVLSGDGRSMSVEGWSQEFRLMKETSRSQARLERVVELPGWHGQPVPTSFMFT